MENQEGFYIAYTSIKWSLYILGGMKFLKLHKIAIE